MKTGGVKHVSLTEVVANASVLIIQSLNFQELDPMEDVNKQIRKG
jgi:hypothetical protein